LTPIGVLAIHNPNLDTPLRGYSITESKHID
jgi:hypothetical protein